MAGGLHHRRHVLGTGISRQERQQCLIDGGRSAGGQNQRLQPRNVGQVANLSRFVITLPDFAANLPQAVGRRGVHERERIVAEPEQHLRRHDQTLGVDALAAGVALPAHRHGARNAPCPAWQGMKVVALGRGTRIKHGIVRRPPNGQLTGVLLANSGAPRHDGIARGGVALDRREYGLFDPWHVKVSLFCGSRVWLASDRKNAGQTPAPQQLV